MKLILVLVLILSTPITFLFAQSIRIDSTAIKTELAAVDAKHFKLDKQILKVFRKHNFAYTSDYFKPTIANVSDPKLLSDSSYVQAYRDATFKKTSHRRTAGHYVLIGGVIAVAVVIAISVAGVAAISSFGG